MKRRLSLAQQLLVLLLVLVAVLVAAGAVFAYLEAKRATQDAAREQSTAVALTVADAPTVRAAVRTDDPTRILQPFAQRVMADTDVDFITIMDPDGTRFTHPNPDEIGGTFRGNTEQALRGRVLTETYTGTLGPSIRAVVPVFDQRRQVVALVSVGVTESAVSAELDERLAPLLGVAASVLLAGAVGVYWVSRRLRRQTHGAAPAELARMFSYYEAILHAVREGLLLVDADGRVGLCNDGARDLLGLPSTPAEGTPVSELGLPAELTEALTSDEVRKDEVHVTDDRVLVVNVAPVQSGGTGHGNVVTLRDHTELQALSGELDSVRGFAESLRSQAHEAANRLHTVVSLVELGRTAEAVEFATAELEVAQQLTDRVVGAVAEPVLAAVLLGKSAEAAERGVELELTDDAVVDDPAVVGEGGVDPHDAVTVLGNLIDNALDAAIAGAAEAAPRVTVTVRSTPDELLVRVADSGAGVPDDPSALFRRGWSTKSRDGRGLGLALVGQVVQRYRGSVNAEGSVFTVRLPLPQRVGGAR